MARSRSQIETSLANRITTIDPTVDTKKGPVPDIFTIPEAYEIQSLEARQDSIGLRYSFDYTKLQNRDIQILYGANHGLRPSNGTPSVARGIAYRYTRPQEDVIIPAGRIVTTTDGTVSFKVTYDTIMYAGRADAYYNATTSRYEVPITLTSMGTGTDFDLPPRTLRKLQEPISGIDGAENVERATQGKPEEDLTQFAVRTQKMFNGLETASADGFISTILNYGAPIVENVIPIFSSDTQYFQRRTRRAAWDIYIRGEQIEDVTATFAANGTAIFVLPNTPVISVSEVRVNDIPTSFSYTPDLSPERRGSVLEYDVVQLPSVPAMGSVITVRYQWNSLIALLQQYYNQTRAQSYKTDILIRMAQSVLLRVRVDVKAASTFDVTTVLGRTQNTIYSYFDETIRREIILPEAFRSYVVVGTPGISNLWVRTFTRATTGTLDVEPIELAPYEYVDTNGTLLEVNSI